ERAHRRVFMLAELVRLGAFPLRCARRDRAEPDPGSVRRNESVFGVPILELLIEGIEGTFEGPCTDRALVVRLEAEALHEDRYDPGLCCGGGAAAARRR